jgi:WD40 repeat protein
VEQVTEIARLEQSGYEVAWSSNGDTIAVASYDAVGSYTGVYLYDAETLEQTNFISTSRRIVSMAISPDGRMVVAGDGFGEAHIWSVDADQPVHSFQDIHGLALSPDGQTLALAEDDSIVIWDIRAGERIATLGETGLWIPRLVFSPDGNVLAEALPGREVIRIWDVSFLVDDSLIASSGESIVPAMSIRHEHFVSCLALSPDARLLATSGGRDAVVRIWDVSTGQLIRSLSGHVGAIAGDEIESVRSVAFSPTGSILASAGGADATVRLWDVRTWQLLQTLEPTGGRVESIAFSPDGRALALVGKVVQLWSILEPQPESKAQTVKAGGFSFQPVAGFAASVEGSQVTVTSEDEKIDFILAGRSSCEVKLSEDVIDAFVYMYARNFEEFEASEPYAVSVAGKEGLSVDVAGTRLTYITRDTRVRERITGRVVLVAPGDSQYFWAFASVADSAGGGRWEAQGQEAFNALLDSLEFSEPTDISNAFPCFTNHTPPEVVVDVNTFSDAGCAFDEHGRGTCPSGSLLAGLGCDLVERPFGGLEPSYPAAICWGRTFSHSPWGDTQGNEGRCRLEAVFGWERAFFCYVVFQDGQFVLLGTEDEFREVFAPVETDKEALSYALAVMAGRRSTVWGSLRQYYGLQLNPELEYAVDVLEDTHVETTVDGYLVHLFLYDEWDCVGYPDIYAVDLHVTFQGYVEQVSRELVYRDPSGRCLD